MLGLVETAPEEVKKAIKSFRDLEVGQIEKDAISDFINVKKPRLDVN